MFSQKKEQRKEWKITKKCLSLLLESAKSSYPNEFAGLLRVDTIEKDTIIEVILLPGTVSGSTHAIFRMHMRPIDFSIVGTIHSHPSFSFHPSTADLQLFRKHGKIHIIIAKPYTEDSWRAYDASGNETSITVV